MSLAQSGGPLGLADAVRVVGAAGRDLSGLAWLLPQGGRTLVRLEEGGEWRLCALKRGTGTVPQPRDRPWLLHEGNFAPSWPGLLNALTSLALFGLVGTGLFLWARRKARRRPTGADRVPRAADTSARA